jgi:Arc/MetJ-type ribon-helix-helix transcriptional regulator
MPARSISITLNGDDAERLGRLMRSGDYKTYEAAVGEALSSLEASSDPSTEHWLRTVVAERFDAYQADPTRGVGIDEARRRILGAR